MTVKPNLEGEEVRQACSWNYSMLNGTQRESNGLSIGPEADSDKGRDRFAE